MTSVLIVSAPHVYKTDRLGHMTPMDEPVHAAARSNDGANFQPVHCACGESEVEILPQ